MALRLAVLALALAASGCVPYTVGGTPRTVAPRIVEPSAVLQIASARRDVDRDSQARTNRPGLVVGNEARLGLDEASDVGVRLTGLGGVTATYKRRLSGAPGGDAGTALVVGAGVIGLSHVHAEATLVAASRPLGDRVYPYYGVRAQALAPFAADAVQTDPALGVFAGGRVGWPDLSLAPELGVFYSPSPNRGESPWILVPSVTVRGERLVKALGL